MRTLAWLGLLGLGLVTACSSRPSIAPSAAPTSPTTTMTTTTMTTTSPAMSPPPLTSPAPSESAAQRALDAMSEAQRVGQLFMVGANSGALDQRAVIAINADHVGSVILTSNSTLSASATAAITSALQQASSGPKLFIATDQEGGSVQRMRGAGFDTIPSAVEQGQLAPATLQTQATGWGQQLAAAGFNLDLAPVADTVPDPGSNPPIGQLDRQYGVVAAAVASHASAFAAGLVAAGVDATAKHFPGLGRVTGNTDTTSGVIDSVSTRNDGDLAPFAALIDNKVPFVMASTAIYSRIDPATPAAFSSTILTGMLRGDLRFAGVIISDDLGSAAQVAAYPIAERPLDFIAAGGDLVLTVDAGQIPAMTAAVIARAQSDPTFAAKVDAATLRVLEAKQARGLL